MLSSTCVVLLSAIYEKYYMRRRGNIDDAVVDVLRVALCCAAEEGGLTSFIICRRVLNSILRES